MHVNLDDYHFFDDSYIKSKNPIMLEVGAFNGDLASAFLNSYPKGRVIIYEASVVNFKSLSDSVCHDNRINIYRAALSHIKGTITLHTYTDKFSHSIFDRACDHKISTGTEDVRSLPLSVALHENGLDYLDFLLLNCEGGELPILTDVIASKNIRDRIDQICVSFHCLHSKMYSVKDRDYLLECLKEWYDIRVGNDIWEYFLLVKK